MLAVGMESGAVSLHSCCPAAQATGGSHWSLILSFPSFLTHTSTVKRLQWRPVVKQSSPAEDPGGGKEDRTASSSEHHLELLLASCSTDHSVKLFRIHIPVT